MVNNSLLNKIIFNVTYNLRENYDHFLHPRNVKKLQKDKEQIDKLAQLSNET